MAQDYDVVIVGAGHNGMAAAGYLSRAGKRVAVVERLGKVGGMTSSGYLIPEAPKHLVTPCAVELLFVRGTGLIEDLELRKHGLTTIDPDPSYAYLHPDGSSIAVFRDAARTADDVARIHRGDGKAYLKFVAMLDALMDIGFPIMMAEPGKPGIGIAAKIIGAAVRNVKLREELTILASGTSDQIACEWFEHPATIALLHGVAAGAGPIDEDGNAAAYMIFAVMHRLGTGKPIGSLQSFANAIKASIEASGATVLLDAPVDEILIEDGAAKGVRLRDGRVLRADAVIATCDPRTMMRLTTPGAVERRLVERIEHAPSNRWGGAPLLANIAMSGPLTLKQHQDKRHDDADLNKAVGLIGTPDEVRGSFAAAKRGDIPTRHAVSVTPMSNIDPSQAPPGGSVAYIYLPAIAVDAREGWTPALKDQTMASTIAHITEFYDGFDSEVGRWVETPREREQRLMSPTAVSPTSTSVRCAPAPNGPAVGFGSPNPAIPGLFIGGAGAHPGGGISGIPGRIAATRVQRYLKKAKR